MASIIQLRNDSSTNWNTYNPILAKGEIGIETDTNQLKIGDGVTSWTSLDYATGGGASSGTGLPGITNVFSRQYYNDGDVTDHNLQSEFRGDYAEILFTTNMSLADIIKHRYDMYVSLLRYKRNKSRYTYISSIDDWFHTGSKSKFNVQNDRWYKTDKKLYCWRSDVDSSLNYNNPMRWQWFYTIDNYNDSVQELQNNNPLVFLYGKHIFNGNMAKNMHIVASDGSTHADKINNPERYEDGDIAYTVGYSTASYKMLCRECHKDGNKYYLWCQDWDDDEKNIVGTTTPDYIPDYMGNLTIVSKVGYHAYTYDKRRNDLDFMHIMNNTFFDNCYPFGNSLPFDNYGGSRTFSNYALEYPIMPTLLADCKIRVFRTTENLSAGSFITIKEAVNYIDEFDVNDPVIMMFPYPTDYLWLRFCAWQKRCLYGWENKQDEAINMKNSLPHGCSFNGELGYCFKRRAFGRQRVGYTNGSPGYHTKITEQIEFALMTEDEIIQGVMPKSTPIQKKLVMIPGPVVSTLRD